MMPYLDVKYNYAGMKAAMVSTKQGMTEILTI